MNQARKNCKIPTYMVPKCPVCGGPMTMNLRCDQYFVQDDNWYQAEKRFGDYLTQALKSKQKILLLELGVGFNTPTIIRFPFEKLVKEENRTRIVREFKSYGFTYVTMDLMGYRMGSMNETLNK